MLQEQKYIHLIKAMAILFAIAFAYFCFQDQYRVLFHPCKCADALAYTKIGELYAHEGIVNHEWGKLRLYAYPLFIAFINIVSEAFSFESGIALFVTQITVYFGVVTLLSRVLSTHISKLIGNTTFFALIANVFLYPYLVISLSDGISVCILICIIALVIHLGFTRPTAVWMIVLGALVGLAMMVRPANIYWLVVPVMVIGISTKLSIDRLRWTRMLIFSLATSGGFLVVVLPQIIINYRYYDVLSFMPVFNLRQFQITTGISFIKYATNLSGGQLGLMYQNSWSTASDTSLAWYFLNPWVGFKTMFLHIFGALDFDYLFCYLYDLYPKYRPLLFLYSQSIVFWGVVGFTLGVQDLRRLVDFESRMKTIAVYFSWLIPAVILGWVAVTSISAVENRFSLPIIALLLPLAAWVLFVRKRETRRLFAWLWLLFTSYLTFAWWVSSFIDGLKLIK